MLAFYLLSLGASAGVTGVFVRQVLAAQGYVPGFRQGVMLAGGVACAYAASQLAFMAFVLLLKPTRDKARLFTEVLSHGAAVIFTPYLLHYQVNWPDPTLYELEPLVYLAAFGVVHVFFKLATFFASVRGRPVGRLAVVGWLVATGLSAVAAYSALGIWFRESERARPRAPQAVEYFRVGGQYARARVMPEGAVLRCELAPYPGQCLSLRWANLPDPDEDNPPLETIYMTVLMEGDESKEFSCPVGLTASGWRGIRVAADRIPENVRSCSVIWTKQQPPGWRRFIKLRPMVSSQRKVLLSGPFRHEERTEQAVGPSFVVVVIEGLGAQDVSSMGYDRPTTSGLDSLANAALAFPNAFTPAPEVEAACMTLLTGTNPLRHGYLGDHNGPLPRALQTLAEVLGQNHYATAAFTEGEAEHHPDLVLGSGFERGFEIFDPSFVVDTPERAPRADQAGAYEPPRVSAGSSVTLEKVQTWIDGQDDVKFLVFVRLRELLNFEMRDRYSPQGFVDSSGSPSPRDVYDSALAYLDRQIGALVTRIRDYETRKNTCIVVTSAYGYDFAKGKRQRPTVRLTEASLRVPLIVFAPGLNKAPRPDLVALEDVAPTLARLAGAQFDAVPDGRDLLSATTSHPVSMIGDPLVLTIRTERWRFSWQSGLKPFTPRVLDVEEAVALYEVAELRKGTLYDVASRYPDVARGLRDHLRAYAKAYKDLWLQSAE